MQNKTNPTTGEKMLVYFALFAYVLIALFVGLTDVITFVLLPALLAYTLLRFGPLHLILHCGVVVAAYSFASGEFSMMILPAIFVGVCIGICFRGLKSLRYTLTACVLTMLASEILIFFIDSLRMDATLQFMQSFTMQSGELISQLGLPTKESAIILKFIGFYNPAIIVISFAMISYAIVFVLLLMLKKREPGLVMCYPRFRDFSINGGVILMLAVSWGIGIMDIGIIGTTFLNVAILISCYMVICGYSVLVFWISKVRSGALRVILGFVLFWMFSLLTPVALSLAVSDMIFRFRKRKRGDSDEK